MKRNVLKYILISGLFLFLIVTYAKVNSACTGGAQNTECYTGENGKHCMGMGNAGNCKDDSAEQNY